MSWIERRQPVIWKFPLGDSGISEVEMPNTAKILKLDVQRGVPTLWALCQPDEEKVPRKFLAIGTGMALPEIDLEMYIGTYLLNGGEHVFHLFEID